MTANSTSRYDSIFQAGVRSAEWEEHCPCAATLIINCGFEPYEARVFMDGYEFGRRRLGLPVEMACDHSSFVGCLAAANLDLM